MKNTYGPPLFPYIFGIVFTALLALLIGAQNWMFTAFFGGCAVFVFIMLVGMYYKVTIDDDGIEMQAYLGFVKDKVLYTEIADMRSHAESGVVNMWANIHVDKNSKTLIIKLKDGSVYNITNDQVPDLNEMIADIRQRME